MDTRYTSRSLRRRRNTDQWECSLSHTDPVTGEVVRTYHTLVAKTQRQAERARDALIVELELLGGASSSNVSLRDFMASFMRHKEGSGTIEPSTVRGYRAETRIICRYLGNAKLAELSIPDISGWMHDMSADGYAPKSCSKAFRLLKQALKWAVAQDLIAKNPCDFCKPPKRVKTLINALSREERTRMLRLAMQAEPQPLGFAVEIALTTGMRRGEVCALRWSDLSDDGAITVSHALGNGPGGFYVKEPKTGSSARTIPLTRHLDTMLSARRRDAERVTREMGVALGDPYILGTQEEESRPYNPTQLGKDFAAFCKMNGFKCTFHDLKHTFATMMIVGGCDVRTVASYLGHASVSMTLDIYADVDPDAKRAAVDKVADSFDVDLDSLYDFPSPAAAPSAAAGALTFSADQLRAMLAAAEEKEAGHGRL
ncbi:tyrosine-type recombinase/integrase [Curtanaerobium respiraculi]|uniref:tyrosine-type recombinase/integrase n=1 Tax=Curtanaerobium respiraculi TaxID=2949669 RepID=UPI0024B3A606|nr:site-specific integrase [Curtanaerobium respiraculi]